MVWSSAEFIKQVGIYNSKTSSESEKRKALELINLNNFKISQNLRTSGKTLNVDTYDRASIKVIPQVAITQLANEKITKKEYDKKIDEFKKIESMTPAQYLANAKAKRESALKSLQNLKDSRSKQTVITPKQTVITPKQAGSITAKTPITGGISFGGEATKKTYLPFAIVAVIGAYFFFNKSKKRRR
jgi:hypothetical protein